MLNTALRPYADLRQACRVGPLADSSDQPAVYEWLALFAAGGLAATAVVLIEPSLRIPGSAILRAALPMICGLALVPRQFAGSVMAVGAAIVVGGLTLGGLGSFQPAAVASLLALGPAIDLATAGGVVGGWRLYLRLALAGILANALGFVVRGGASWLALDTAQPHHVARFGWGVLLSFAACGLVAGLVSAVACFRASAGGRSA